MTALDIVNQLLSMRKTLNQMDETITVSLNILEDPEAPNPTADKLRGEQWTINIIVQWLDSILYEFWKSEDRAESLTDLLSLNEKR